MNHKLLFVLVPLAFTVACGDDGGGGGTGPQTIITMSGTVEITGDRTASGAFSNVGYTLRGSCAEYALEGSAADDPGPMESTGTF